MSGLDPNLAHLVPAYKSAELVTCGLIRTKKAKTAIDWGVNVFSVLRFLTDSLPPKPALHFITPKSESLPSSDHKLLVTRSELSVNEAIDLFRFNGAFPNPRVPSTTPPLESRGTWVGPEFVGQEDHRVRSCVPVQESFWLLESWHAGTELEKEVGKDGIKFLCERIHALINVDLDAKRERLGNFLIAMPECRHRMRVWWPLRNKLGVEICTRAGGPTAFGVMVRASRDNCLVNSEYRIVDAGLHVFEVPEAIDHRAVELYEQASGIIMDRDAGTPMRAIGITGGINSSSVDFTVNFTDGSPAIRTKTTWGSTTRTIVGGHKAWELELSEASEREQKERLRQEKKFIVYRGAARTEAVQDIRNILHGNIHEYLKIWDPYFGPREAAEFLPYVFDPSTLIQILTSTEPTPQEQQASRASNSFTTKKKVTARITKKQQLKRVIDGLREPQPGVAGLRALECRVGAGMFHDRFIITRERCWQLGCSLNQIGEVMSTIVEFPYPALIEREFDRTWNGTKEAL